MARRKITKIVFGTSNMNKFHEVDKILAPMGFTLISLKSLGDIPEAPETADDFLGSAEEKALFYSKYTDLPVLAEDDGIEVEILDGAPGVHTKRYAELNNSNLSSSEYLLEVMKDKKNRSAKFHAGMVLVVNGKKVCFAEGICEGRIALEKKGNRTKMEFDTIFIADRCRQTFAEQGVETKSLRSHRAIATRNIVAQIIELFGKPY